GLGGFGGSAGTGDSGDGGAPPSNGTFAPLRPRPDWGTVADPADLSSDRPEFDLRTGTPDTALFPFEAWRRLLGGQARPPALASGTHGDPAGLAQLRDAMARHIGVARSVRATADDVIVTTGVQQGTDLAIRVLLEPGDLVAVENPGYTPTRRLFESAGMRVV